MRGVVDIEQIKLPGRADKDAVIITELPPRLIKQL